MRGRQSQLQSKVVQTQNAGLGKWSANGLDTWLRPEMQPKEDEQAGPGREDDGRPHFLRR
jgi:hypothetical protein